MSLLNDVRESMSRPQNNAGTNGGASGSGEERPKSLVWLNKVGNLLPGSALLLQQLPMLLEVTAFTLLYSVVPNAPVRLRHAVLGGLFTAVLFDLAKWVFAHRPGDRSVDLHPGR